MNDGIYYPFGEKRFAAYQDGIERLVQKVDKSGARLILMTPPAFDPLPLKKKGKLKPAGEKEYAWFEIYEGYDDVLRRYAEWLSKRADERVERTIDLHSPVSRYVSKKRRDDADFTMSPDGVHVNNEGHAVLANAIAESLKLKSKDVTPELLRVVGQRQKLMHDAWLSHVGHKRPGVKAGLPLDEAQRKYAELQQQIDGLLK